MELFVPQELKKVNKSFSTVYKKQGPCGIRHGQRAGARPPKTNIEVLNKSEHEPSFTLEYARIRNFAARHIEISLLFAQKEELELFFLENFVYLRVKIANPGPVIASRGAFFAFIDSKKSDKRGAFVNGKILEEKSYMTGLNCYFASRKRESPSVSRT